MRYHRSERAYDVPETEEERRARRQRRLRAEEEALAQADIWTAIAEQTKNDAKEQGKLHARRKRSVL